MLSTDLLEKIFTYLPILHIARARVVCKQWQSILCSQSFLRNHHDLTSERWVVVLDRNYIDERRILVFYDLSLHKWIRVALTFLPSYFVFAAGAGGGLLCLVDERGIMCVCNPLTRTYKRLPDLPRDLHSFGAVFIEGNGSTAYKVLVLSGDTLALYSSNSDCWLMIKTGLPSSLLQIPVACNGVLYDIHCISSEMVGWELQKKWRLVCNKLDKLGHGEVWNTLHRQEWGKILDILREPHLMESNGCLLLAGALTENAISETPPAFVIFKLDLATLAWSEAARMPFESLIDFQPLSGFKIFGGGNAVFFSSKGRRHLVVCDFSAGEGSWHWIEDCPRVSEYGVIYPYEGYPFHPRLDVVP